MFLKVIRKIVNIRVFVVGESHRIKQVRRALSPPNRRETRDLSFLIRSEDQEASM